MVNDLPPFTFVALQLESEREIPFGNGVLFKLGHNYSTDIHYAFDKDFEIKLYININLKEIICFSTGIHLILIENRFILINKYFYIYCIS